MHLIESDQVPLRRRAAGIRRPWLRRTGGGPRSRPRPALGAGRVCRL